MILCKCDATEGNPDNVAYTCVLLCPIIVVSHPRFNFLCLLLLYGIYLCGSEPLNTNMPPIFCFLGTRFVFMQALIPSIFNLIKQHTSSNRLSYSLICSAWLILSLFSIMRAILYFVWITEGTILVCIAVCQVLQIFYSRAILQRKVIQFPAFFGYCLEENIVVCAHTTRLPKKQDDQRYFCMKRLSELFS